jgi:triacylglycerol lipase
VWDWVALHASSVYIGRGVPRGDGSAVVVVPGFLGSDRYLMILYLWLRRIGYRPYYSGIGRNVECPDLLARRLLLTVEQAHLETGKPVRLVGHSLGGTLARAVAQHAPAQIAQIITLGSPIDSANVHPLVLVAQTVVGGSIHRKGASRPDCYTDACTCDFAASVERPLSENIARHAIYSRSDGVVDWRSCLDADDRVNIEVKSTHLGLAFNPQVYREVARLLAGA